MNLEILKTDPILMGLSTQLADAYKQELDSKNINASGKLSNFNVEIDTDDHSFMVIFELESYWKYVEKGRGPGKMPPISSILDWIRVKPIIPRAMNGRVPSANQLAFVIARSIGQKGTPARFPLREAMSNSTQIIDQIVDRIKQIIIDNLENILQQP